MTKALRDLGKAGGKVKMVGFDAGSQSVADLKRGDVQGLVVQNPVFMGYKGVMTMIEHLQGKKVEKRIDTGVMLAGGPDEVARMIREEHETLVGLDLMLANVYAAGVEQERVRRTISLLAGPVREQLAEIGAESRTS